MDGQRRLCRAQAVDDGLRRATDMSRLEVMVRELGSMDRHRRHLECLGHVQVQTEPTARDRPLVQRLADERVRKREAIHSVGILHD